MSPLFSPSPSRLQVGVFSHAVTKPVSPIYASPACLTPPSLLSFPLLQLLSSFSSFLLVVFSISISFCHVSFAFPHAFPVLTSWLVCNFSSIPLPSHCTNSSCLLSCQSSFSSFLFIFLHTSSPSALSLLFFFVLCFCHLWFLLSFCFFSFCTCFLSHHPTLIYLHSSPPLFAFFLLFHLVFILSLSLLFSVSFSAFLLPCSFYRNDTLDCPSCCNALDNLDNHNHVQYTRVSSAVTIPNFCSLASS